jgi:hypothetical protein
VSCQQSHDDALTRACQHIYHLTMFTLISKWMRVVDEDAAATDLCNISADDYVSDADDVLVETPVVAATMEAPLRRSKRVGVATPRSPLRSRSQSLCHQRSSSVGTTCGKAASQLQVLEQPWLDFCLFRLPIMEKTNSSFAIERSRN